MFARFVLYIYIHTYIYIYIFKYTIIRVLMSNGKATDLICNSDDDQKKKNANGQSDVN